MSCVCVIKSLLCVCSCVVAICVYDQMTRYTDRGRNYLHEYVKKTQRRKRRRKQTSIVFQISQGREYSHVEMVHHSRYVLFLFFVNRRSRKKKLRRAAIFLHLHQTQADSTHSAQRMKLDILQFNSQLCLEL